MTYNPPLNDSSSEESGRVHEMSLERKAWLTIFIPLESDANSWGFDSNEGIAIRILTGYIHTVFQKPLSFLLKPQDFDNSR